MKARTWSLIFITSALLCLIAAFLTIIEIYNYGANMQLIKLTYFDGISALLWVIMFCMNGSECRREELEELERQRREAEYELRRKEVEELIQQTRRII